MFKRWCDIATHSQSHINTMYKKYGETCKKFFGKLATQDLFNFFGILLAILTCYIPHQQLPLLELYPGSALDNKILISWESY